MEAVCYYAYDAPTELTEGGATTRCTRVSCGTAASFRRIQYMLAEQRCGYLQQDLLTSMDWSLLRERIKQFGMHTRTAWRSSDRNDLVR